tara:strand:- start:49 stop:204 length:156 start_codon:yes stop_codon:yes gene_type:complete
MFKGLKTQIFNARSNIIVRKVLIADETIDDEGRAKDARAENGILDNSSCAF